MPRPLLLLAIVLTVAPALARAEPLDEAAYVQRAVAADPRPRLAAVDEAVARADELELGLRANPELTVDREHVVGDAGEVEHVVALDLPLDLSGRRGKRVSAARARAAAAGASRRMTELEVALEATLAYREASYRRARAAVLAAGRAELARAVETVRARVKAGDAAPYELERAELELAEHDDELAAAELARVAAERELGAWIGVATVEASAEVPLAPAPASEDALLARAAERPELEALRHLARAAAAERAAAARAWVPDLVVTGGAKRLASDGDTRWGYVVGLGLELPIFGRGDAARARAAVDRERVRARETGLAERTAARIAAARAQLVERRALAERSTSARLERVAAMVTATEAAYREGGALVELLDAYRTRQRASLAALAHRHDTRVAEVDLWRAIGRLP